MDGTSRHAHSMDEGCSDDGTCIPADDDDGGGGGGGGGGSGDDDDDDDDAGSPPDQPDCLAVFAGINTPAGSNAANAISNWAANYPKSGVDVATPYGSGRFGGVLSVLSQAMFGPNQATRNFASSLATITSTNSNVTLVLFSGSAQSFNTALAGGLISQSTLDSISQIIYLSPGSPGGFGNPQYSDGSSIPTTTYTGQGFVDGLVTNSNINGMPDATAIDGCGHSVVCDLGATDSDGDSVIGELPAESDCSSE